MQIQGLALARVIRFPPHGAKEATARLSAVLRPKVIPTVNLQIWTDASFDDARKFAVGSIMCVKQGHFFGRAREVHYRKLGKCSSSVQAEYFGMLMACRFAKDYQKQFKAVSVASVTIYYDCIAACEQLIESKVLTTYRERLPHATFQFCKVKSHVNDGNKIVDRQARGMLQVWRQRLETQNVFRKPLP